jgi:hypothetical protein
MLMTNPTYEEHKGKEYSPVVALKHFFGLKVDETTGKRQTLQEFIEEMKELNEEEKMSLARLACEEMGATLILKKNA